MRKFYLLVVSFFVVLSSFCQTQRVVFDRTGSDRFTVPCGVTSIIVEAWGAGAAGSGDGGGGGGAYARKTISVSAGTSYNIQVGRGGGTYSSGGWYSTTINEGENSAFGNLVVAEGGGNNGFLNQGGRKSASVGDMKYSGGNGGLRGTGSGGSGGGGSAGSEGDGMPGVRATGNGGGSGGNGGDFGGGAGGNGGIRYANGSNGNYPGGGGGERGAATIFSITNNGDGADGQIIITYESSLGNYCPVTFSNIESITNLTFSNINNTTARNSNTEVESFCTPVGEVVQGATSRLFVQGYTAGSYTNYFTAFIDWNQDGDFTDAGEKFTIGSIRSSTGLDGKTAFTDITVPLNAKLGNTKLRVIKNYNTSPEVPCGNYTYGQAEEYIINITGNCMQPTGALANETAGEVTVCAGTPVTLKQTGGTLGAGASWKWYSGSCGGTLLNTNTKEDGAFTFTPTTTGTYFVRAEGGSCSSGGACKQIKVIVATPGTIKVTSGSKDFLACKGIANNSFVVFTIGGGASTASVTGLPAGMSGTLAGKNLVINGNAAVSGTFTYTIKLLGNSPCDNPEITGTIQVNEAPSGFSYENMNVTYCAGSSITPNGPVVSGGVPNVFSVVGNVLPAGLSLNTATGEITGVPALPSAASGYTIRAANGCGFKDATITIRISTGNTPFDVTPGSTLNYCGTASPVLMGLSGSEVGVKYRLYLNDVASGTEVTGTGNPISFGTRSEAGTYTVKTTNGCISNMNGSNVINTTPQPNVSFSFPSYSSCKTGTISPTISGMPQTGYFSASPSGISIDVNTGKVDLAASAPGTYTISYTVAAAGACGIFTYTQGSKLVINGYPDVQEIYGGGSYCAGTAGLEIGLENSQAGVRYELLRNGIPVSPVKVLTGTGSDLSFGNQTAAGTYTVKASFATTTQCSVLMDGEAVVVINQPPSPIAISPKTKTICQGEIIPLSTSFAPPTTATSSVILSSGALNGEIPNNDALGISNLLKVTGVPAGATINSVVVRYKITHDYTGDLFINLKGPNGKVLNLANGIGGTGKNFTNTTISSAATNNISTYVAPYSGTYAPQASMSVSGAQIVTANVSNVASFSELFGAGEANGNGNWTLSVRDKEERGYYSGWLFPKWNPEPTGYLNDWTITINYSYISNPAGVLWSPANDLFTDPGATIPYTEGTLLSTVYAKPSSAGLKTYTATAMSPTGCNAIATTNLTVNPSPVISVAANYCDFPGKVRITAKSDITVSNWKWSGNMGTGTVSGNTSYVEPNTAGSFYVTATSTGNSCSGLGEMSIAQELVVNGDFEAGNTGFSSDYQYVSNTVRNGLVPRGGLYTVHSDPNFTHSNFWGADHTIADGNGQFMLINGTSNKVVWKQTVTVIPGTTYYFSAYAVSLNDNNPFANLIFRVNSTNVGSQTGALPSKSTDNNPGEWRRFYGTWQSGSSTTAVIEIINQQNAEGGNDFGLDDISFGTLSTFFNLTSAPATENQSAICVGSEITEISYEAGGDGNPPSVASGFIPQGLTTYWNGRNFKINGTPEQAGTYSLNLVSSGCNPKTKTVKIVIDAKTNPGTFENEVVSVCNAKSASVKLTGQVGTVTQWQRSTDGGLSWSNITGTSTSLAVSNVTEAVYYKATVKNKSCDADTSPVVKVGVTNLWTGEKDRNFSDTKNWSDEVIPFAGYGSACPTVMIPAVSNQPVLASGQVNITNLQVAPNAALQVNGSGILGIAGTITNMGTLDVTDGTLEMNGTIAQSLSGNIFKDRSVKNLVVSNEKTLSVNNLAGDTLNITGALTFGTPASKLNTGDNITLKSTAFGTAAVGVVSPQNIITGKFIVERFINTGTNQYPGSHSKSWQLLAAPVMGVTIREAWQEGAVSDGKTPLKYTFKGFGTLLTTGRNNVPANGFDLYTAPGPSIKSYDPDKNSWDAGPEKTSDAFYNPNGYLVLVRGDRTVFTSNAAANPTVLRAKGQIITGNTTPITVKKGKFQSIGNPYPSPVKISGIKRTGGVDDFFYVWDPTLTSYYGLGAYRTLYKDGNVYRAVPSNGSYPEIIENIESGQAFIVKATTHDGTVYFTEASKGVGSKTVLRPEGLNGRSSRLEINLFDASGSKNQLIDGSMVQFGDYEDEVNHMDAVKLENSQENLGVMQFNNKLAVNRRSELAENDTIYLSLSGVRMQKYRLELTGSNLQEGVEAWLEDRYLDTRTALDLNGKSALDFAVANIAGSYASDRFRIVFKSAPKPLPMTFASVAATKKEDVILVEWTVENEDRITGYQVETSKDGITYVKFATIPADKNGSHAYRFPDTDVAPGDHYYRIKSLDESGAFSVSETVKVFVEFVPAKISVFPNPVVNGQISVRFDNQLKGIYYLRLLNPVGQVIYSKQVAVTGIRQVEKLKWDYKMAHGVYQMEVTRPDASRHLIQIVY